MQTEESSLDSFKEALIEKLAEHFECPVCSEEMGAGVKIFACSNDHWICSECMADKRMCECPSCREGYENNHPRRCLTAERIARELDLKSEKEKTEVGIAII